MATKIIPQTIRARLLNDVAIELNDIGGDEWRFEQQGGGS